jgi:hypothetical protein
MLVAAIAVAASAAPGTTTVSAVLQPLNGVWLDSTDGGHYWDVDGNGICRVDNGAKGPTEKKATCDLQAKKPTQVAVGPHRADGTYFLYVADMSSKSTGPLRLVYDPAADSGKGHIVLNSANILGGIDTAGFFSNAKGQPPGGDAGDGDGGTGSYRSSSVALGPCSSTITTPCTALYVAFEKSKKIERINFVDQSLQNQSIETISQTDDPRKGVRYGIADFRNADGTDDLYIEELGGEGVSVIKDVATCTPSEGSPIPGTIGAPTNTFGGCQAVLVPAITTNFAQGIAVQENPDGTGRYLYVGDSPENTTATVLRYHPDTGYQDVVSTTVTPYDSLQNPGQIVSTYTAIGGLAINPHTGDLYIGDDPTFLNEQANETVAVGHIFEIPADSTHTAPADCTGSATTKCEPPAPPGTETSSLFAYGVTAPAGGVTFLPSDDGGHVWAADESMGLCRFDTVPQAPQLHASNQTACDDGLLLGAGGQVVYDDSIVPGTTNQHYLYVAQNDHLSPGVVRFTFDPGADGGAGDLVAGSGVVMAPNAGLDGDKANGLALGPCPPNAPATCKHSLYLAGLLDGFVRRIDNPADAPRDQIVDIVAETTAQKNGQAGRGINGSMGMLGDNLYLPEDQGFTVIRNASTCGVNGVLCATVALNIGVFGSITGTGIAVDPNPLHSAGGLVYASESPDAARATIYQYDVATNTSRLLTDAGQVPGAGTAAATVYCTLTCQGRTDAHYPPGAQVSFRFAQGLYVDPAGDGTLYVTEDASQGNRSQRGHIWTAPFSQYPSGQSAVAIRTTATTDHTCAVPVTVPALATGDSYWVGFTTRGAAPMSSTWQLPSARSAQLVLRSGTQETSTRPSLAKQESRNTADFVVGTGPAARAAGTYTAEFHDGGAALRATTAMLSYDNGTAACPTAAQTGQVVY